MEVAELELKPLRSDSRSLALDASPSYSSENPVMGPQPGKGTVSHLTCPPGIKIKCEYVEEQSGVGDGVLEPELSRFSGCSNLPSPDKRSLCYCCPTPDSPPQHISPSCPPCLPLPLLPILSHRHQHILKMFPLYKSSLLAATRVLLLRTT